MPFRPCKRCGAKGYHIYEVRKGCVLIGCGNGHLLAYGSTWEKAERMYYNEYWTQKEVDE